MSQLPDNAAVCEVAPEAAESSVIETDVSCARCGYNLRTLSREGRCPECGLGVAESLRSDKIDAANPLWRQRLEIGIAIRCLGMSLIWIVTGISFLAEKLNVTQSVMDFPYMFTANLYLCLIGDWLITSKETDRVRPKRVQLASWIRGLWIIAIAMQFPVLRSLVSYSFPHVWAMISTAIEFGITVTLIVYLIELCRRLPDYAALHQWRWLLGLSIFNGLFTLIGRLNQFASWNPSRRWLIIIAPVIFVTLFGQEFWMIFLLIRLHKRISGKLWAFSRS